MLHSTNLIITLAVCFGAALLLGFLTQKLKMSPIVGYLIAGIIIGPYSLGFADIELTSQLAEIGVILLMFGVGLHFNLKDLNAVKDIAITGSLAQIVITTFTTALLMVLLGFPLINGIVFGIAISVASTVVLMRVLSDNKALHTPVGHTAIGWLIIEDLFTIVILVLLPSFFSGNTQNISLTVGITILKIILLIIVILFLGQKLIPIVLKYVAKTGTRDLFTLAILALALGIAVGASEFFGASMALGAFLAGMVIGQSDFSARAASEALPMRDAFAVLFFVSVGMLFNPASFFVEWKLILLTLFIVIIIKPLAAILVIHLLKHPFKKALLVGIVLSQIGEFSFILISLGISLNILTQGLFDAAIATAIISITLNPLIYKFNNGIFKILRKLKAYKTRQCDFEPIKKIDDDESRVIIVGYGPIGKKVAAILQDKGVNVLIIEMNLDTVEKINNDEGNLFAVYGDASQKEILLYAGIENAYAIVISSVTAPAVDIVEIAHSLNPQIKTIIHTMYIKEAEVLKSKGVDVVFSGENEVAKSLSDFMLKESCSVESGVNWNLNINCPPD